MLSDRRSTCGHLPPPATTCPTCPAELFVHKLEVEERNTPHFRRRVHRAESRDPGHVHLTDCYRALSLLSVFNEQLTLKAGYTRGGGSTCKSRGRGYLVCTRD